MVAVAVQGELLRFPLKPICGCLDLTMYEDAGHRLSRIRPCHNLVLHGWKSQVNLARSSRGRRDPYARRHQRHHPAGRVSGLVHHRCLVDLCGIRYCRQQNRKHRSWSLLSPNSVVGAERLVDHRNDSACSRSIGGMLVHCSRRGLEMGSSKCLNREEIVGTYAPQEPTSNCAH